MKTHEYYQKKMNQLLHKNTAFNYQKNTKGLLKSWHEYAHSSTNKQQKAKSVKCQILFLIFDSCLNQADA